MESNKRAKYWDELKRDEKIERLADKVFRISQLLASTRDTVNDLRNHKHCDGQVVVPIQFAVPSPCESDFEYKQLRGTHGK
jgi:hypothetical protein